MKIKQILKNNYKFILGFILGLIWSGGIVYATANGYLFDSGEVSYDNTSSGLTSENVQDALDELYIESTSYQLFEARVSALEAYKTGWQLWLNGEAMTDGVIKALPSNWNELLIYAAANTDNNVFYTFNVYNNTGPSPAELITGYGASGSYVSISIINNNTKIKMAGARIGGAGFSPIVYIFYR